MQRATPSARGGAVAGGVRRRSARASGRAPPPNNAGAGAAGSRPFGGGRAGALARLDGGGRAPPPPLGDAGGGGGAGGAPRWLLPLLGAAAAAVLVRSFRARGEERAGKGTLRHCCAPLFSGLLHIPQSGSHAERRRATMRQALATRPRAAFGGHGRCCTLARSRKALFCRRRRRRRAPGALEGRPARRAF